MKKVSVISTYPQNGSCNIGDHLITKATIDAINAVNNNKNDNIDFSVLWRSDKWRNVSNIVRDSNFVVFSCLAIRQNMNETYPYVEEIIECGVPFCVLSAGTALEVGAHNYNIYSQLSKKSLNSLNRIADNAVFFTNRGFLTQAFCDYIGLSNTTFSGDIAFYDRRFFDLEFKPTSKIDKIAISDPHYPKFYMRSFSKLCYEVKNIFPSSEITIVLHGKNPEIENFANAHGLSVTRIYLDKDNGLDFYDNIDLHIGYRVHAHVSSLVRRKPSYLIEQDGRGCDYGLTINCKCSVPQYINKSKINFKYINTAINAINYYTRIDKFVCLNPIDLLVSMVKIDFMNGFDKFVGIEKQIAKFNLLCIEAIKNILSY